jgi:hypothetical protein
MEADLPHYLEAVSSIQWDMMQIAILSIPLYETSEVIELTENDFSDED